MSTRAIVLCVTAMVAGGEVRAQSMWPAAELKAAGSVTGQVSCADTNRPARFARVTLEPVEDLQAVEIDKKGNIARRKSGRTAIFSQTGVDGSYSIEKVPPGRYYIVAELPGYLSPLTEFTSEDVMFPREDDERRFRTELEQVTVADGQTSRMDFRLERGASISGRVLYDDGGVVTGALVSLLRKQKDGSWKPALTYAQDRFHNDPKSDDQGHYRIALLPEGEYLVTVDLGHFSGTVTNEAFPAFTLTRDNSDVTHIYSGDTARRADAKPIKLYKGEDYAGADITIPLSRLHTVSGTVVARSDGHAINRGTVVLEDLSDGTTVKQTWLAATGRFSMELVPEGQYRLKVSDAADAVMETRVIEGSQLTERHARAVHAYSDTERSLQVAGEISGVTLTVADRKTISDPAQTEPSN